MSIYSIMAFNAATDKMKENIKTSQDIEAKKVQTATAQEELNLNKKLNQAKIKQARNEGLMSDYIGSALEKKLNETHKAKADQLDAISGLQDMAEHKTQQETKQAAQFAEHLYNQDTDVQGHVSTLSAIMKANQNQPQMSVANPGNVGTTPVNPQPSPNAAMPSVLPSTGVIQQPAQPPMEQPEVQPVAQAEIPQEQQSGIDLSPIEQSMGYPKGSLWIDPSTMKPAINPIWKSKIEKQQAAEANYGVDSPSRMFKEEMRQDKNIKTAETYLVNASKSKNTAIGFQNSKVDAALHARKLISDSYDPATGNYNVTQVPYAELAESVGALLSGNTGTSEGRVNSLKQRTAKGDLNGAISYFTGKPSNATSQEAIKQLVHIIDRQGELSEELRDKAFNKLKELPTFKRLDSDSLDALKSQSLGNSFVESSKEFPDNKKQKSTSTDYSHLWE